MMMMWEVVQKVVSNVQLQSNGNQWGLQPLLGVSVEFEAAKDQVKKYRANLQSNGNQWGVVQRQYKVRTNIDTHIVRDKNGQKKTTMRLGFSKLSEKPRLGTKSPF